MIPLITQHFTDIKQLQAAVRQLRKSDGKKSAICLAKGCHNSNTTRASTYKQRAHRLDIKRLNRILKIDPEKKIAYVEPGVSMQKLALECLSFGLIPPVIPEFKGISVGGAINGCAGESSSHRYGLFHNVCSACEILLGDGQMVRASAHNEYSDLFHAVAGSYGSLGIVVGVEIPLIDAASLVALKYRFFSTAQQAITYMRSLVDDDTCPFVDGIVFSPTSSVVIEASFVDGSDKKKRLDLQKCGSPWFYQHVKEAAQETVFMSFYDYLFRYDRGAFWMGTYVLRLPLVTRFIFEGICKLPFSTRRWPNKEEVSHFSSIRDPGFGLRACASWAVSSQRLYNLLHLGEEWIADRFIIQDFMIRASNAVDFVNYAMQECPLYPLWLCPIRKATQAQFLSPHLIDEAVMAQDRYCINVGLYGMPKTITSISDATKRLEQKTESLHGRKVLYAQSYYTNAEFWQIYPETKYRELREKYMADGAWMSIEEKVLFQAK